MSHETRSELAVNRRGFFGLSTAAALGLTLAGDRSAQALLLQEAVENEPPVPPGINWRTIAEAEKIPLIEFTQQEREQILLTLPNQQRLYPFLRESALRNEEGPAEVFNPRLPGFTFPAERRPALHNLTDPGPLPRSETGIAFAPCTSLAWWLRTRQITSEALTRLYLDRLKRIGPRLECTVTLMEEPALAQARSADAEIAAGRYRGPLHGIPWGAKDLFDTNGVLTTYGAAPFRNRVPDRDAAVVRLLDEAGAVLIAKLTLGALAYGDIWFGGRTRNPWNTEQGSSGSSAGSASAAAAGLVGFALGTETYGSIGSPSARCGATGFRPTFGRVSRAGAMALCWSLDKVGPIARTAADCALVLNAINAPDPEDPATADLPLNIDMAAPIRGMRIGFPRGEFDNPTDADRAMLDALRDLGAELVPVEIPGSRLGELIFFLISVEAAAAFDELTRDNLDDLMAWQDPPAWPNTFRMTRLAPAVEYMQARRLRGRLMRQTDELFRTVDAVVAPRFHGPMHALTNMTGHPAITIRQGFAPDGAPFSITLWGRLYEDARLLRIGSALEDSLGLWTRRPPVD